MIFLIVYHRQTNQQTKNIIIGKQKKKEAQSTQTDLCFIQGGKEIVLEVGRLAQQTEIDKVTLTQEKSKTITRIFSQVRLFTEEVDKITSLVIGLSSRLAKASLVTNNQQDEKLQVTMMTMMLMMVRLLLMTKQK